MRRGRCKSWDSQTKQRPLRNKCGVNHRDVLPKKPRFLSGFGAFLFALYDQTYDLFINVM